MNNINNELIIHPSWIIWESIIIKSDFFFPEKTILQKGTRQYKFSPPEYKMGKSDYNIFCEENICFSKNDFNHSTSYNFLEGHILEGHI